MKTKILLLVLALTASSCCSVTEAYLAADQATHQAIAPEYRAYVLADPNLGELAKKRRIRTLDSWARRLASAAGSSSPAR